MSNISQLKLNQLIKLGEEYKIPFHLPPFDGDTTEGFYDIHEFKETKRFQDFIKIIEKMGIKYEYAFKKGCKKRIFMAVKVRDNNAKN